LGNECLAYFGNSSPVIRFIPIEKIGMPATTGFIEQGLLHKTLNYQMENTKKNVQLKNLIKNQTFHFKKKRMIAY
jgi:hypothetical protein